ncbi:hypothetical protein N7509_002235 [Penicillium cosmopolitanum]|uniref:Carrier domain-containing protein n=1 Tax=Penicillium cosmopolitanum TaxID=1131564 RepID=A0A9W9W8M6_9EURO|nr:uncharacterized protein N7509_002235 [Penicillium cosmopolitanum]KAJ5408352.1 hypothetical protein N7509_002235 [Penicillium cosmopolitanum]
MGAKSKRLLLTSVDDAAEKEPDRRFAVIPKGSELSDGFMNLTMKELARAVNCMAWWIESVIGKGKPRQTLAYMASNDVRYCIFLLACQKTGHQAFFPSTRNSDEAFDYLLKVTECSKFFLSEERSARVSEIHAVHPGLETFNIPSLKTLLSDKTDDRHYPFTKAYAEVEDNTAFIIHSSGTTGMPKPVYLTNGFMATLDMMDQISWPEGRESAPFWHMSSQELVLATTPFFHLMGFFSFAISIFHSVPVLIGPEKPLSVDYLVELFDTARPTGALLPPSVLEDMCYSDKALESLRGLKSVYFGGAPLAYEKGEKLRKYTRIVPVIGASEIGWILAVIPEDEKDWPYFEWNPEYGIEMQDNGDEVYEMVIKRSEGHRDFQGVFHTFPDLDVYHTKDLYTQHPTKPNLWKYNGRKDDVIVLSNGEKFNPVSMELIIEVHPLVSRALVIGQSRFQAGLLIEPNPTAPEMDSNLFIDKIWPTVQAANQTIAAHGRVMKSNIGFASKAKPFKTTPKGTTQRRAVARDYEKEIDQIYEAGLDDDLQVSLPEALDTASISDYVTRIIGRVLEKPDIPFSQDLYSLGLDSLMTIQIAKALQKGIQERRPETKNGTITSQTLYANPTVKKLVEVIINTLEGKSIDVIPRSEKIQNLVKKYTDDLPSDRVIPSNRLISPSSVILTGSTGSLGTYLLHDLLSKPAISKIYCLNRSDAESRQKKSLAEKGLLFNDDAWKNKVEFLQASFGEPRFGLEEAKYQEMLQSVDTIIHNAWKVDFNHSVESFEETHIRGMRRFVDFSLASRYNAHIHFVSSISTVGGWSPQMGHLVPELPMEDSSVVLEQGYGESKHISERICLEASTKSHVPTTVYRVGQIAGPTTSSGQWNPHEWLPTIISTSKAMGKIPNQLGSMAVDWVPVDTLSSIMSEIVHCRHASPSTSAVFHLTNAETTEWSTLLPVIKQKYDVKPVEFKEWVADLESIQNPTSAEVADKPALKLLSFYRGLVDEEHGAMSVPLDVKEARQASRTMEALGPISAPLMQNWLEQWQF